MPTAIESTQHKASEAMHHAAHVVKHHTPHAHGTLTHVVVYPMVVNAWASQATHHAGIMYLMEFIGTVCLNMAATSQGVFPIGNDNNALRGNVGPFTVAAMVAIIVGAGASISGAHYNPNLTLSFWIMGDRLSPNPLLYVIICLAGAVTGQAITLGLGGTAGGLPTPESLTDDQWIQALGAEFLGAFFSSFVVMYVAKLANPPLGNSGPIVVAFGFFAAIMITRDISGAVINPGVCFGLWVMGLSEDNQKNVASSLLLYWLFELLGALCSGLVGLACLKVKANAAAAAAEAKKTDESAPPVTGAPVMENA